MTKFKIRERLKKTKLQAFEKAGWVTGNTSAFIEKLNQGVDIGFTFGGAFFGARTAATDIGHAVEDYICSDYKCLTLDCIATCCDVAAFGISFLPKTNTTGAAYAGCASTAEFSRRLRNKCKQLEGGLFGCK